MANSNVAGHTALDDSLDEIKISKPAFNRHSRPSRNQPEGKTVRPQDSWRSYSNDTTNLQQIAGYANAQDGLTTHDYNVSSFSYRPAAGCYLNPSAEPFKPASVSTPFNPAQHQVSPAEPLRSSSEGTRKKNAKHPGASVRSANDRNGKQYAFRSRGPAPLWSSIRDVPLPSIEQQARHSSGLAINLAPDYSKSLSRRVTSRNATQSATPPPVPVPVATKAYLSRAALPPSTLSAPKHLLVVVDLNGTLLKRRQSRGSKFTLRPGVTQFMEYLFANHVIMIYTSARPDNAAGMVDKLLTPAQRKEVVAIWARDKLDLTAAQYKSKVQVYKKLDKIWNDPAVQKRAWYGGKWDQGNTVLIDDSHLKALAQPHNLLKVEEFVNDRPIDAEGDSRTLAQQEALDIWTSAQEKIVRDLQMKLEELKWTQDVSQLIREWQLVINTPKDSEETVTVEVEEAKQAQQTQLLTPESSEQPHSESDQSDGGVDSREVDLEELAKRIDTQLDSSETDTESDKSVSPIDESVWQDILGDIDRAGDTAQSSSKGSVQ